MKIALFQKQLFIEKNKIFGNKKKIFRDVVNLSNKKH